MKGEAPRIYHFFKNANYNQAEHYIQVRYIFKKLFFYFCYDHHVLFFLKKRYLLIQYHLMYIFDVFTTKILNQLFTRTEYNKLLSSSLHNLRECLNIKKCCCFDEVYSLKKNTQNIKSKQFLAKLFFVFIVIKKTSYK